MTNTQLVEIQPHELKFTFEVKKQSSCAVHLANITDQYVAFKVKTTSPKKYCVRPNIGVIKPKSTYDFTVTMQAQRTLPSDMPCKDKFLIQSTVVPFGTNEEEITPSMFNKDNRKSIEECKLRVVLVSPPNSPVLQPANGVSKQGAPIETSMQQENFPSGVENLPPAQTVGKNNKDIKFEEETEEPRLGKIVDLGLNFAKNTESDTDEVVENSKGADFVAEEEEPNLAKTVEDVKLNSPKNRESNINEVVKSRHLNMETTKLTLSKDVEEELKSVEDAKLNSPKNGKSNTDELVKPRHLNMETTKLSLSKDVEELKSKINSLDSQLIEAECIIAKFKEEKRSTIKDMETLKQELALLRTKSVGRKAQVGFPPLFLCMVAFICFTIGYLLRA
ncbi:vesicle-associated protein 2-2 isoform X2 [Nicotiana tabacum]|uniref:Vesicle-associated protein 2-2 isoform X2 n=1 Tax=Nicotiana tabacum TaxID=4097 RepID=A0A1S3YBY4_TOBAC|nr:vesicle-associated protein 2-2 isoform X2 [Nicotiana tomentosiformis]XP_016449725.1 PREDICTED: vesicle-associated protein 2-2-like isoform X2 [Nicotiana tabacum]